MRTTGYCAETAGDFYSSQMQRSELASAAEKNDHSSIILIRNWLEHKRFAILFGTQRTLCELPLEVEKLKITDDERDKEIETNGTDASPARKLINYLSYVLQ